VQGKHSQMWGRIEVWQGNCQFLTNNSPCRKRWEIRPRLHEPLVGSRISAFNCTKFTDLGWPWTVITHSAKQIIRISELITEIWKKTDSYYPQRKCSSGQITFRRYKVHADIRGVPWRGAPNVCGLVENDIFSNFDRNNSEPLEIMRLLLYSNMKYFTVF